MFNGTNYTDWLCSLRIFLNYENQGYIMDKPLLQTLPAGPLSDECDTFESWHADHRKVRSIILVSMSNGIWKQYDRLDDVASILQSTKKVYGILDRHTRFVATKEFFRIKMTEGSSVQEHGVKMLSLVEKLKNLKVELDNDTNIDVILQLLPPSYDPFIVNINMNGLEKSINELINILVQYKAMTKKSALSILVGEEWAKERGSWVLSNNRGQTISAPIAVRKSIRRGIVPNSLPSKVLQKNRKLSKDEVVLRLGDGKAVATKAIGIVNLVTSDLVRSDRIMIAQNKHKLANLENAQIWHARIGHVSEDRIKRNAVFLKRGFPADTRCDELLLEESSKAPQSNAGTSADTAYYFH
ncbi:UNVERIFIED_CONTAM: hypothetical protein Scaly_0081500 [Sesamum calycinum]|uniref:Uncharacterized protein n=1 Tax=Sesamum calycinum TaxID=2727403 RepID=A0AAW2SXN4_9LAMI